MIALISALCCIWTICPVFQMYIEFCGGGAVDSIMQDLEKPLTEPQIRCICREMLTALEFLHSRYVIHRDMKAGNVLLTIDGQVKLGMFSGCVTIDQSRPKKLDDKIKA